jgi:hypothetical protein
MINGLINECPFAEYYQISFSHDTLLTQSLSILPYHENVEKGWSLWSNEYNKNNMKI